MFSMFTYFVAFGDVFRLRRCFPPSAICSAFGDFSTFGDFSAFGDFSRLRRFFPPSAIFPAFGGHAQFFLFFRTKSGESGLGTLLKRSALKFCIEWSNRELLRPSRRRDMAISLFRRFVRLRRLFPPSAIFPAFGDFSRLRRFARLSARKASILQSSRKLSFAPKRAKLRANAQKRRA